MSTDLDSTFNEQFMSINMRLKRRFMRKPNMSECLKEFLALAVRCEYSDQPTFAGHAYVGAAKCEASVGNVIEEADYYLNAGKQYMKAEKKLRSMKFYSPDRENLEAAIGCYMMAFYKHPENMLKRGIIFLGLTNDLITLGHKEEALSVYELAIDYIKERITKLTFLKQKMNLEIECGKYGLALETANKIADKYFSQGNCPLSYLTEVQTSRILLSLLTKPSADSEPSSLKQLFTDLMNNNESDLIPFNPELMLQMQSIISTTMAGDVQTLVAVAADAVKHLTRQQEELLQTVISRERAEYLALT